MTGGNGNDTYVVNVANEVTTEDSIAGSGTDTVKSSVSWTLATNVENLTLTGFSAVSGTGNVSNNVITGNGAVNTLTGLDGNDTLDGGGGIDTMIGGIGNDTYHVAQADVVTEGAGAGTDTVISTLGGVAGYTLAVNAENLTLGGNASINGTGNGENNVITGNAGFNVLNGGAGADTINGAAGADTINGGAGIDVMTGGNQIDTFVFSSLADGAGDSIMDFVNLEHITLTAIDAREDLLTDQAFILSADNVFVQGEIGITYATVLGITTATVGLYTDADATAEMTFTVNIGALTTLVASDFDL